MSTKQRRIEKVPLATEECCSADQSREKEEMILSPLAVGFEDKRSDVTDVVTERVRRSTRNWKRHTVLLYFTTVIHQWSHRPRTYYLLTMTTRDSKTRERVYVGRAMSTHPTPLNESYCTTIERRHSSDSSHSTTFKDCICK